MENSENSTQIATQPITEMRIKSYELRCKIQSTKIKKLETENEVLKQTIADRKIPSESAKMNKLRRKIVDLEDEIAMLREQNGTLQRWHKEDMENLKDDFAHEREELEKKVRDAEYNSNKLSYEIDLSMRTGCIHTKYIKELEDILKANGISFIKPHGEYKDAMNEAYKM